IPIIDSSLFLERNPFPLYNLIQSNEYNKRLILSPSYYYPYYNGSACWLSIIPEFGTPSYSYGKGLGLVQYDAHPYDPYGSGIYQEYIRLVYYKKGSETWGNPLTLSTYSKLNNNAASLFPNPLKQGEQLYLATDHFTPVQTIVYNGTGNKVLELINNHIPTESIDVSMLQAGLYIVQLINEKNEYTMSKLLIK
ncbi:MAG: T9SS type A sorting domain-containing protein, partial [Cytophagaceae bacterium]|nr:T9SS type A sorting domain-containing protein [Cytophagaceae bacterium]